MAAAVAQEPRQSPSTPPLEHIPLCWGHRGASAAFPENTLASFEAAIQDGAEGIETDVHITADDVIVMFHDPLLDRTTDGSGSIHDQKYHGEVDQLRTRKAPHQKIPTLQETLDLLMMPANQHVLLNIDIKVNNDPERLFSIMSRLISSYPEYDTKLAPRLILGLWHPKYIEPACRLLPHLRRAHIGMSPAIARRYFWDACDTFSMNFACLVSDEGVKFRKELQAAGKDLTVWTVNARNEMIEATKWGAKAILTDRTKALLDLRAEMQQDWDKVSKETTGLFRWTSFWYTGPANASVFVFFILVDERVFSPSRILLTPLFSRSMQFLVSSWESYILTKTGGAFLPPPPVAKILPAPIKAPTIVAKVSS